MVILVKKNKKKTRACVFLERGRRQGGRGEKGSEGRRKRERRIDKCIYLGIDICVDIPRDEQG